MLDSGFDLKYMFWCKNYKSIIIITLQVVAVIIFFFICSNCSDSSSSSSRVWRDSRCIEGIALTIMAKRMIIHHKIEYWWLGYPEIPKWLLRKSTTDAGSILRRMNSRWRLGRHVSHNWFLSLTVMKKNLSNNRWLTSPLIGSSRIDQRVLTGIVP